WAPGIQIDHDRNGFDGGRWIFVNAELSREFFDKSDLIQALVKRASAGEEEFSARPVLPLYLPGEPVELQVRWHAAQQRSGLSVKVAAYPEAQPSNRTTTTAAVPAAGPIVLAAPSGKGLYIIEAQLLEGEEIRAIYHSGFWVRDEQFLRSGPRLTVN